MPVKEVDKEVRTETLKNFDCKISLLPCYYCWCIKFSCSRATRNRNDPSKVSVLISIMTPSALPESIALDQSDYSIDQTPQIYRKEENEKIDSFYEESKKHEKPEKKGTIFFCGCQARE